MFVLCLTLYLKVTKFFTSILLLRKRQCNHQLCILNHKNWIKMRNCFHSLYSKKEYFWPYISCIFGRKLMFVTKFRNVFFTMQGVHFRMIKKILPCFPVAPALMLLVVFTADLVFTIPSPPSLQKTVRYERLEGNRFEL